MQNKSNFNQAIWLAISYTCSMLVGILSSVILSRYFDKVQYGTYKQIIFVYNTLITIFQAGLPAVFTYFLPRYSKGEGKFIVRKLQILLFLLGACFAVCLFFGSGFIASLLNNPELTVGLRIFSVFPLFTLPTLGVEGIYTVNKNTRFVAIYQIVTRLTMLFCIVIPVIIFKNDYRYALVGWGVASFVAFLIALVAKNRAYKDVDSIKLPNLTKEIFVYSLPIMGAALVSVVFNSANQFFISRYYGTIAFAEFSNGFLTLPFVPIFIAPVRAVLTPVFAKASAKGEYGEALNSLHSGMQQIMTLMVPMIVFAFFFAREIMVFLYSSIYENSNIYFQTMLVYNYAEMFIISFILSSIGKPKITMYISIVCAVVLWILDICIIKSNFGSPYLIVIVFVFVHIVSSYVIPGFYLTKKERMKLLDRKIIIYVSKITLHTAIIGFLVYFSIRHFLSSMQLFWILCIGLLCYYALLLATMSIIRVNYFSVFYRFIKKK